MLTEVMRWDPVREMAAMRTEMERAAAGTIPKPSAAAPKVIAINPAG